MFPSVMKEMLLSVIVILTEVTSKFSNDITVVWSYTSEINPSGLNFIVIIFNFIAGTERWNLSCFIYFRM